MGCCGNGNIRLPAVRPSLCADGRYPNATPDAFQEASVTGVTLCGRTGSGPGGLITKPDVTGWATDQGGRQ